MKYAVVNTSTNRILRSGNCNDAHLADQALSGELAIDISSLDWSTNETQYFYDGTSIQARTALTYSAPSSVAVNANAVVTALANTTVCVDGVAVGEMDGSGSETLVFTDAGTYAITLALWPYLDANFSVVVS
jgi:hypothetical protein